MAVSDDFTKRRPYNAVSDFVDANVARGLGSKLAFVDPDRSLTYRDLQARSCQFARALQRMGLRQESRIALLLPDTVDYPVAFWGAVRAGIIVIPLNTWLKPEQYAYILGDSRAALIVASAELAKPLAPVIDAAPYLQSAVLVGGAPADKAAFPQHAVHLFEDLLAPEKADVFAAPTVSDEVAFWLYTSGSTGDPKGVKHVHTSPMATAKLMGQGIVGIRADDVTFSAAKLFFAYGMGNAMSFPLSVGATSVLWPQRPTPEAIFHIMRAHRPTIFYGVPSLYTALLAHTEIGNGRGLRPASPLRVGRRSAARAYRRALARGCRRRCARRHWLDRDAADVCRATGRATSATAPPANRSLATTSSWSMNTVTTWDRMRSANWSCAVPRPGKVTGTSAPRSRHFPRRLDLYRRQVLPGFRRLLLLLRPY